jgi:hypothetical protein
MNGPKRKPPSMAEKLASALLELQRLRGDPIPREHAKMMSAEQINSLFQFDHAHRHANGGSTHPTNLTPLLIGEHREKTAKVDVPELAKGDRLRPVHIEFQKRVLAKAGQGEAPPRKPSAWGSRPLNTKGAKLRSRNNLRRKAEA